MAWTRDELQAEALTQADMTADQAGGSASVLRVLSAVHAAEWKGLLNAHRFLRMAERTITLDSDSRLAITALSDLSSPDAEERFYRVLALSVNDVVHREVSFDEAPLAGSASVAGTTAGGGWRREGDYLRVLPLVPGQTASVWVSHTPTPAGALSQGASTVAWPDDYELLLAYEVAAKLLARAGRESQAANDLRTLAGELRLDLLADLGRTGTGRPIAFQPSDSAGDWG